MSGLAIVRRGVFAAALRLSLSTITLDLNTMQKQAGGWRDGFVSIAPYCISTESEFNLQNPHEETGCEACACNLWTGQQRQEGTLASRPSRTGKLQVQRKPVSRDKSKSKIQPQTNKNERRHPEDLCYDLHIYTNVHLYTYVLACKHANIHSKQYFKRLLLCNLPESPGPLGSDIIVDTGTGTLY